MVNIIGKILERKFLFGSIAVVFAVVGYYGYQHFFGTAAVTRYVSAQVQKGTLVVSVSGSGQVSVSNQLDLKPKVSGDIVSVAVENGQEVKAGTLIAQIDSTDAQKAVRDAEVNLDSAKLALEKLKQPADALSITQAENVLSQADSDLPKSYDSGFNSVSGAFIDLPSAMTGLQDILYGTTLSKGQDNISAYADLVKTYDETVLKFRDDAAQKYQIARTSYDKNATDYKIVTRFSGTDAIEQMINETYDTTKNIADAIKSANDLLNFVKDRLTERNLTIPSLLVTHQNELAQYTNQVNTHLSDLANIRDSIVSAKQTITEKTEALAKLKAGADPLDIQSQELSVKQKENALQDAKENLADYFIRAPFDGIVAKTNVEKGDPASASTVIATFITKQQMAQISLNEVDVAKVKVGQKTTITFDAIDGLGITGEVAEIDSVGTVTQGVVTYGVQIGFDAQDERVKPGMSVNAEIITDVKQNVLLAPNSAVKQQNNAAYVEMFLGDTQTPEWRTVQTGLSNDTMTEIVSGLKEGDQIVTQTIAAAASQSSTQQNTGLRIPGLIGGGGVRR